MNAILEYNDQIINGLVVSEKIRKTYNHIVRDILNNPLSKWEYDEKRANKALIFIESYCKHSKGAFSGMPFLLELWEKAAISVMFGIVNKQTRFRKYRFAFLMVARKNGKSTLAAAIGLYLLMMDGEGGPEIYACATVKDQAKIIWNEAVKMIHKSPSLRKRAKTKVSEIVCDFNEGVFKPLGRDSDTKDGLNVSGATMDEIEQWTDENVFDVIIDGTSARNQPFILATCTAGTVRDSVFDRIYDDAEMTINSYDSDDGVYDEHSLYFIYELDLKKEWMDEKCWGKANPSLGTVKNIDTLRDKVERAKKKSSLVKNLVCKDFNIRETAGESWLSYDEFRNYSTFTFEKDKMNVSIIDGNREVTETKVLNRPRYGIGGIDLSQTTDLTCATVLFKVKDDNRIYVRQMYWLPSETLDERERDDERPYRLWVEQGLMRASEGNKIDYKDITKWFLEVQNEEDIYIFKIGYDFYSATYLIDELKHTFGESVPEAVHQGKQTLSSPMHNLGEDLKSKRIIYNDHRILKWCLGNVSVDMDKNGNIQPIKGKNRKKRIDGFASLLDAYVEYERVQDEYANIL